MRHEAFQKAGVVVRRNINLAIHKYTTLSPMCNRAYPCANL